MGEIITFLKALIISKVGEFIHSPLALITVGFLLFIFFVEIVANIELDKSS